MSRLRRKIAIWSRQEDANCRNNGEHQAAKNQVLDNRHRNHDGEISHKHGNTLIGTLQKDLWTEFRCRASGNRQDTIERGSSSIERNFVEPAPPRSRNRPLEEEDSQGFEIRLTHALRQGRFPAPADVRSGVHFRLKSDIASCPTSAQQRT